MQRLKLSLLSILLIASPVIRAQEPVTPEAAPLHISSLQTGFGIRGEFTGEYQIYPDSIKVTLTQSFITVSTTCPYQGRRHVGSIQIGLGAALDGKKWDVVSWSTKFPVEKVLMPGNQYDLDTIELDIPRKGRTDLANCWLVIQVEDTCLDLPDAKNRLGYHYAHSDRHLFRR